MSKFTVAIIGAGLSGLALAISLERFAPDVDFEIYEGAAELAEIGAGIGLAPRTWAMVQALGIEDALLKISGDGGCPMISLVHRKSDQAKGVDFDRVEVTERNYSFHRADLQNAFLKLVRPPRQVRLGKRVLSYEQSDDGIVLRFQFSEAAQRVGRTEEAAELRSHKAAVFSGEEMYRCLIRKDQLLPGELKNHPAINSSVLIVYCGKNRHLVTYPIAQGRIVNVGIGVSIPGTEGTIYEGPWTSPASKDDIVKGFESWEPQVQDIIKHVDSGLKWAINVVTKLPTFVQGRVALVGDAAHAMCPHLGAGAGQCIEDAFMLAQLLGRPAIINTNVSAALQVYDEIRRPFTQTISELARKRGQLHHLTAPQFADLTPDLSATGKALAMEQLWEVGRTMQELRDWQDGSSVAEDVAGAMQRLDRILAGA
ncbi:FAD/NAD(P)-binding domain-containing protein [Ganoderma leucocontextum]|nr:FAD/NAD(P)-binding domain-containing protein [Ganoderma leucocontextum]